MNFVNNNSKERWLYNSINNVFFGLCHEKHGIFYFQTICFENNVILLNTTSCTINENLFLNFVLLCQYEGDQKITVIYVGTLVCYVCRKYQTFWIVSLFSTDKKVDRVLVCCSIFYYSKKCIKETVLS